MGSIHQSYDGGYLAEPSLTLPFINLRSQLA